MTIALLVAIVDRVGRRIKKHKRAILKDRGIFKQANTVGVDIKYARRHIQCDCGHYSKEHYVGEGFCDKCACTWYYPNTRWIKRQQKRLGVGNGM